MEPTLTPEQVMLLGLVTAGIIQSAKIVWMGLFKKPKPTEGQIRWIVFVVSIAISYFWSDVALPPITDPMAFAVDLIIITLNVFVFAHLIYATILKGVLEWIDGKILRGKKLLAP